MKRTPKTIFERSLDRYFQRQVDRALDEAAPLSGWTAWYVRKRPELREYYEQMLEMELELRFPNVETDGKRGEWSRPSLSPISSGVYEKTDRRELWAALIVLLIAIGITAYFSPFKSPLKTDTAKRASIEPSEISEDESVLDLADFIAAASPLGEILPTPQREPSNENRLPALNGSIDSIVRFSQHPLESTLSFLESTRIITRQAVDSEDL